MSAYPTPRSVLFFCSAHAQELSGQLLDFFQTLLLVLGGGLRETFLCQRFQLLSRFLDQFPVFFPVLPGHFHDLTVFSRHIAIVFPHMGKEAVGTILNAFLCETEITATGHLLHIFHILSYVFPVTGESRQDLLVFNPETPK